MAAVHHLGLVWCLFVLEYLIVFIVVETFVVIDSVLSKVSII